MYRFCSYADISNSTKQDSTEPDNVSQSKTSQQVDSGGIAGGSVKEAPPEDTIVPLSPSYLSEASDAFGNTYQPPSQVKFCFYNIFLNQPHSIFIVLFCITEYSLYLCICMSSHLRWSLCRWAAPLALWPRRALPPPRLSRGRALRKCATPAPIPPLSPAIRSPHVEIVHKR